MMVSNKKVNCAFLQIVNIFELSQFNNFIPRKTIISLYGGSLKLMLNVYLKRNKKIHKNQKKLLNIILRTRN